MGFGWGIVVVDMKITLKSTNTEHYPAAEKTLIFIPREDEVVITTESGKEIASLRICIMDKETEDSPGKWNIEPSDSYWLEFHPVKSDVYPASADVYMESESDEE